MKQPFAPDRPYLSGETVTPGTFTCERCGQELTIEERITNLPVCPNCQNDTWNRAHPPPVA